MFAPSITCSILCYNYGRYLAQAIESCLGQKPGNYSMEILILDDGSTDDTPHVCARFGQRIRVSRSRNLGFSRSLDRAVKEAAGDYVCLLDADDWWEPHKIVTMLPSLEAGALFVKHPLWLVDGEGRRSGMTGACGNTSSLCVHRESARTLLPGSSELFCHPLMDAGRGVELAEALGSYRVHESSMTDRSATSAHTAFFARTAHLVADRLDSLRKSPPAWTDSGALRRIARRYRAEGYTKDFQRVVELRDVRRYPMFFLRAVGWWLFSGRLPGERHARLLARALLNLRRGKGERPAVKIRSQGLPRVVQTCGGRFHHFELAKQLYRHGLLSAFYTGYPRMATQPGDYPQAVTHVPLRWEISQMGMRLAARLRDSGAGTSWRIAEHMSNIQDATMCEKLGEADIVVALSGSSLRTARQARARGVTFVCDRGSQHIRAQDELLHEEYARWGQSFIGVDPRRIAKEEEEYELADAITVPSEFARASYLARGVAVEKVRVINYGVDLDEFRGESQAAAGDFDVIFIGNVSFRKGIPYLLEAFRRMRHPRKRLRIVGSVRADFTAWLRRQNLDRVEFSEQVFRPQLRELLLRSHVLVLPSVEDGFGLVVAEAMACGCPPIVSANAGAAEFVVDGKDAFVVPPRDAAAISEALTRLADEPDRRGAMGIAGRESVNRIGGWDEYGDKYAAMLRELWINNS